MSLTDAVVGETVLLLPLVHHEWTLRAGLDLAVQCRIHGPWWAGLSGLGTSGDEGDSRVAVGATFAF